VSRFGAALKDAPPAPIPPTPVYYEPNSSFTTSDPETLGTLASGLSKLPNVDIELVASSHKIKGIAYGPGYSSGTCNFRVFLYTSSRSKFLVEFQRRSGCGILFRRIYTEALALAGIQSDKKKASPLPLAITPWNLIAKEAGLDLDVVLNESTAKQLWSWASEDLSDQSREALRLLSSFSDSTENQAMILRVAGGADGFTRLVLSWIESWDTEISRYGCLLLANVCIGQQLQEELGTRLFEPFCSVLSQAHSLDSLEAKRIILRCLDSFPKGLALSLGRQNAGQCARVLGVCSQIPELSSPVQTTFLRFQ